ncbi:MAG: ParB/RepB/Spo0J family partition protein [Clostridia bacterium]|nr:ParB/RepB/Spo0J family partition protein [Clostridia bacterium]
MAKMTGLGKGLDALFGGSPLEMPKQNDVQEQVIEENENLRTLKITEVEPNREQPRKTFKQEALEELAESIKTYGIIQPIVVTKKDGYYSIIAGERRWRAAKLAGLSEIPAIVREDDEQVNKEIALIENIQREDLNPFEKALGIRHLMEKYGMTQEQVAKKLGKSRSSISNTVRVLYLVPDVLELVKQGKLTEGHCKALAGIEDPDRQYAAALRMVDRGESVRQAESKNRITKKEQKVDPKYRYLYEDIEDKFQGFFGSKVKLDQGKRKGRIIIEYSNNEDLERMLNLIK